MVAAAPLQPPVFWVQLLEAVCFVEIAVCLNCRVAVLGSSCTESKSVCFTDISKEFEI